MTTEEKMLHMYAKVHGEIPTTGSCRIVVSTDFAGENPVDEIQCLKEDDYGDYQVCWSISKSDLLFDYMTLDMKNT